MFYLHEDEAMPHNQRVCKDYWCSGCRSNAKFCHGFFRFVFRFDIRFLFSPSKQSEFLLACQNLNIKQVNFQKLLQRILHLFKCFESFPQRIRVRRIWLHVLFSRTSQVTKRYCSSFFVNIIQHIVAMLFYPQCCIFKLLYVCFKINDMKICAFYIHHLLIAISSISKLCLTTDTCRGV